MAINTQFTCGRVVLTLISSLLLILTTIEIGDLSNFDTYLKDSYLGASPVLAVVGLMYCQIALLRATAICLCTVWRFHQVQAILLPLRKAFANGFRSCVMDTNVRRVATRFAIVFVLASVRFAAMFTMAMGQSKTSYDRATYFVLTVSNAEVLGYWSVTLFTAGLTTIIAETVFIYSCAELVTNADALLEHIEKETFSTMQNAYSAEDFYGAALSIQNHYEKVVKSKVLLEDAIKWQVLISILGNCFELLVGCAWFIIYAYMPRIYSIRRFIRYALSAPLLMLQLWFTLEFPVLLWKKERKIAGKIESLVYWRQKKRTKGPSLEEYQLLQSVTKQAYAKRLTLSAGGIFDLTPYSVMTLGYCIIGFIIFAVDRMENTDSAKAKASAAFGLHNDTLVGFPNASYNQTAM